ncbi:MAG: hypothetical protein BWX70_03449 [Verrucomicrobia bacterium ADurb.Bin070]|nr:MAG: hypothetical protein BWX70_03449 [Verrucomicrobia bacterium ADurb.Bin070]
MGDVGLETVEVAVIDADRCRAQCAGTCGILLVKNFGQDIQAERTGERVKGVQGVIVKNADDQQDGVRVQGGALVNLIGVDNEILAQHRQRRGVAGLLEVGGRAFEEGGLGQDRERGGPAVGIGAGDGGGSEIGADVAARGRGALEFRDHVHAGRVERGGETARPVATRCGEPFELGLRNARFGVGDFFAF